MSTPRYATADGEAQHEAALANDEIKFAGRTRGSVMHLIAGAAKKQGHTTSICGQAVGNTWRVPSQYEKVCKLCQRGDKRAAFTSMNQPRTCTACGKRFADSTRRDNGDSTCPNCWEAAGIENEHLDGGHKDQAVEGCVRCERIHSEEDTVTASESPLEPTGATAEHTSGAHSGKLIQDCAGCQNELRDVHIALEERAQQRDVEFAERRLQERAEDIVSRLRRLADDIERESARLTAVQSEGSMMDVLDVAGSIANSVAWAIPNMRVHDLVRDAAELRSKVEQAAKGGQS
jgi:predicted Zn-ribbon and HTH transcriptional regulator